MGGIIQLCRATPAERALSLAGDEHVVVPRLITNHAVSIEAGREVVWPWLAQIGQGRGGFYSYSFLENMIGCRISNADRIHPQWQSVRLGDEIAIHPRARPLKVVSVEPNAHLVLSQDSPLRWTWSFNLRDQSSGGSRLIVRTRVDWRSRISGLLIRPVMSFGHYVMERKMLLGIKVRAEKTQADRS
ncbi:MAG: hypothetical protein AAF456_05110 [Planctomycetota bacterium]